MCGLHHLTKLWHRAAFISSLLSHLTEEMWTNSLEWKALSHKQAASLSQGYASTAKMIVQLKAPPTPPTQLFITNFFQQNSSHTHLQCVVLRWVATRGRRSAAWVQLLSSSFAATDLSGVGTSVRSEQPDCFGLLNILMPSCILASHSALTVRDFYIGRCRHGASW